MTATIRKASSSAPINIAVRSTRRYDPLRTMISRVAAAIGKVRLREAP